jgi:hypothetical protein
LEGFEDDGGREVAACGIADNDYSFGTEGEDCLVSLAKEFVDIKAFV